MLVRASRKRLVAARRGLAPPGAEVAVPVQAAHRHERERRASGLLARLPHRRAIPLEHVEVDNRERTLRPLGLPHAHIHGHSPFLSSSRCTRTPSTTSTLARATSHGHKSASWTGRRSRTTKTSSPWACEWWNRAAPCSTHAPARCSSSKTRAAAVLYSSSLLALRT